MDNKNNFQVRFAIKNIQTIGKMDSNNLSIKSSKKE